jgi:hypothetical protein
MRATRITRGQGGEHGQNSEIEWLPGPDRFEKSNRVTKARKRLNNKYLKNRFPKASTALVYL